MLGLVSLVGFLGQMGWVGLVGLVGLVGQVGPLGLGGSGGPYVSDWLGRSCRSDPKIFDDSQVFHDPKGIRSVNMDYDNLKVYGGR